MNASHPPLFPVLRKASDSGASSPATPHKSVEGESSPAGPLVRSLSCDSSNGGDAAVADYDRYKYRQKYKLEKKDKEAKLQAMQARHAEQLADKDNQIDLIVTDSERLRRQIRSVEMDKETLEVSVCVGHEDALCVSVWVGRFGEWGWHTPWKFWKGIETDKKVCWPGTLPL